MNNTNKQDNKDLNFLEKAKQSVLPKSNIDNNIYNICKENIIKGYDFNEGINYEKIFNTYINTGFQAYNLGKSFKIIDEMLSWRLSHDDINLEENDNYLDENIRKSTRTTIFFGYTSNLISSGLREIIRYLAQHKMIDVIVTTAGGVEEDFIKCLAPTYKGEFHYKGSDLRDNCLNRIGNMLVPNDNYCMFEDWIKPRLQILKKNCIENNENYTPSKIIEYLGSEINNEESVYYWCAKNKIPVFCPALTDGSIGDMMFFDNYSDEKPRLKVDIIEDICKINKIALKAKKTGMLILGGGIVKHHINNANLMRNGADYAVLVNTAVEYDGSDAGALPDEAVSWGKIKGEGKSVKVHAEATLVFPIIVAKCFANREKEFIDK